MADTDDDDVDGRPDGEEDALPVDGRADLVTLDATLDGATLKITGGTGKARVWTGTRQVPFGSRVALGSAWQGLAARARRAHRAPEEREGARHRPRRARRRDARRGRKEGRPREEPRVARAHAAGFILDARHGRAPRDPRAARRWGRSRRDRRVVQRVRREARRARARGARAGAMPGDDPGRPLPRDCARCASSSTTSIARTRSSSIASLRAEVGGAIVVRSGGRKQAIRVLGPRASDVGPIGRYRVRIRPIVLRATAGGAPAIGGNDAGAVAALRAELALASATWGQCGISFGEASKLDVTVVDPPPPHLVSLGDDVGLPASGGEIQLRVDGKPIDVAITKGDELERASRTSSRARSRRRASPSRCRRTRASRRARANSVDLSVKRRNGTLATIDATRRARRSRRTRRSACASARSTSPTASSTSATWTRWRARSKSARS